MSYLDLPVSEEDGYIIGASNLFQLDDVNLSIVTNNQVLKYDAATAKWINTTLSGGGNTFTDGYSIDFTLNGTDVTAEVVVDTNTLEVGSWGIRVKPGVYSVVGHTHSYEPANSNIQSHIADGYIHFTQGQISIPASQISDFDSEVSNNTDVSANTSARHSHGNLATLDSIGAQDIIDWDAAVSASHSHDNKAVIDGISSEDIIAYDGAVSNSHNHVNKSTIDQINDGYLADWNWAYTQSHSHANKATIDTITSDLMNQWSDGYNKAHVHANQTDLDNYDPDDFATAGHSHTVDNLSDVVVSDPQNGQVLKYSSTDGYWKNDIDGGYTFNDSETIDFTVESNAVSASVIVDDATIEVGENGLQVIPGLYADSEHSHSYEPANANIQSHISDGSIHNSLATIKGMTDGYYSALDHTHTNLITESELADILDGYMADSYIPDLDGYVNETLLSQVLDGYALTSIVDGYMLETPIPSLDGYINSTTLASILDGYMAEGTIPNLDGYVNETLLASIIDGYAAEVHTHNYEPANANIQSHISDSTIHNSLATIKSMTDGYYSALDHTHTLNDLSDVVIDTPLTNHILKYDGANWVNSLSNSSTSGTLFYFNHAASADIGGYEQLRTIPSGGVEVDETVVVGNNSNAKVLIDSYSTMIGVPNADSIPPGIWTFHHHNYVSNASDITRLVFDVYKRASGGTETLLFSVESEDINALTATSYTTEYAQAAEIDLNLTDRIVIKVSGRSSRVGTTVTLHWIYDGLTSTSNVSTPVYATSLGNSYVLKTELAIIIDGYVAEAELADIIDGYATSSIVDGYVNQTTLSTILDGYVGESTLSSILDGYSATGHTHSYSLDNLSDVTITDPADNQYLRYDGSKWINETVSAGTGDVAGPASSTDNAIVRFNGDTGKIIQNSDWTISDTTGQMSAPLGSNTAPSYIFGSDVNTGIYSAGADTLNLATNGVSRLQIDSAGQITVPLGTVATDTSTPFLISRTYSGTNAANWKPGLTVATTVTGLNASRVFGAQISVDYQESTTTSITDNVCLILTPTGPAAGKTVAGYTSFGTICYNNGGAVTDLTGVWVTNINWTGTGTTTNMRAFYAQNRLYGTWNITNKYGFYIESEFTKNTILATDDATGSTSGVLTLSGGMGVAKKIYSGTSIYAGTSFSTAVGTAAAPSITCTTDANTGIYFGSGSDELAFTTGGVYRAYFSTTSFTMNTIPISLAAGSVSAPSLNINDANTGLYKIGDDNIGVSTNGVLRLDISTTAIKSTLPIQLSAQNELRFADSDSSHYVGFKSPATVETNKIWTLPSVDGSSGQVMKTDGSATLSWITPGDVVGPASAVGDNFASYNSTTGKLIKDSGYSASSFATAAHSHSSELLSHESFRYLADLDTTTSSDILTFRFAANSSAQKILLSNKTDTTNNVMYSTDYGKTWTGKNVLSDYAQGCACSTDFATQYVCFQATGSAASHIYKSTDSGANWTSVTATLGARIWSGIACSSDGSIVYACVANPTNQAHLYKSTDSGANWVSVKQLADTVKWYGVCCSSDGQVVWGIANDTNGIYKSTNGGTDWIDYDKDFSSITNYGQPVCNTAGTKMMFSTLDDGFYLTTDSGTNWSILARGSASNISGYTYAMYSVNSSYSISADGNLIYMIVGPSSYKAKLTKIPGLQSFIFYSADGGTTWNSKVFISGINTVNGFKVFDSGKTIANIGVDNDGASDFTYMVLNYNS